MVTDLEMTGPRLCPRLVTPDDAGFVRRAKTRAIAFYRRLGMTETGQDAENLYFGLSRDYFCANKEAFMNILQGRSA